MVDFNRSVVGPTVELLSVITYTSNIHVFKDFITCTKKNNL